ncbi:MAG: MarR family transcriptional regulator [Rhodanobacter sp.]
MARLQSSILIMDQGIGHVSEMIPQMPAAQARLCRLVLMVGDRLQLELAANLKPHRLNHSEFITLMMLYGRPDGSSTPGELCEFATQGAANMTRIANALAARGLITRSSGTHDRRQVVIRITAAGRRLLRKVLPPLFPRMGGAFAGFSDGERDELDRLLGKLALNLDHLDAVPAT